MLPLFVHCITENRQKQGLDHSHSLFDLDTSCCVHGRAVRASTQVTDGLCASDLSRSPQVNRCRQRRTTGESEKGEDYIFRSVMAVAHLVLISIEHHAQE